MQADFATHNDLTDINETLEKFHNRFHVISPIFQQIKTLTKEFKNLSSKHPSVSHSSHHRASPILGNAFCSSIPTPTLPLGDDPFERIATIEHKLTNLERRVVGDGVAIGTFSFQSLEDVRSWCETHLPTKRMEYRFLSFWLKIIQTLLKF